MTITTFNRDWSTAISLASEKTYESDELFWKRTKTIGLCALGAIALTVIVSPIFLPITYTALFSTIIFSPWAIIPQLILPPLISHLENLRAFKENESLELKVKARNLRTIHEQLSTQTQESSITEALEKTFGDALSLELKNKILSQSKGPFFTKILSHLQLNIKQEEFLLQNTKETRQKIINEDDSTIPLDKKWAPLFQIEQEILAIRVSRIFLWTFLSVEEGEKRFQSALDTHHLNVEKALYEFTKKQNYSLEEYASARFYSDDQAEQFLKLRKIDMEEEIEKTTKSSLNDALNDLRKIIKKNNHWILRSEILSPQSAESIHDRLVDLITKQTQSAEQRTLSA
jgi:hypothetical protein